MLSDHGLLCSSCGSGSWTCTCGPDKVWIRSVQGDRATRQRGGRVQDEEPIGLEPKACEVERRVNVSGSQLKSGAGRACSPFALVPQPQRWLFVRQGPAAASGADLLSTLTALMRSPSGCFCCISRCSWGACRELSADPAAAPSRAPRVLSMLNIRPHLSWRELVFPGTHIQTNLHGPILGSGPAQGHLRRSG